MNFERFKELKPQPMALPAGYDSYFEQLYSLKSRPSATKILSVLSAVAAAVLIVTAVSVWALIGHGIRERGNVVQPEPGDITQQTGGALKKDASINTLQREEFFNMFAELKINAIPEFSEGETPDIEAMKWYVAHLHQNDINSGEFPAEIFADEMKEKFGLEYDLGGQSMLTLEQGRLTEFPFAELIGYSEEQTDEGTVVTATAATYYMWNLTEQNCEELYPYEFATAKSTIITGGGNTYDISAIYEIKYITKDGKTPQKFISLKKHIAPSDEYTAFFE